MMRALSNEALLTAWECGSAEPQITGRVLAVLRVAYPEIPPDALTSLPIGQRDGLLLSLREAIFGSQLEGIATCSGCGERLRVGFQAADIRVEYELSAPTFHVEAQKYSITFRLPNSGDLMAIGYDADLEVQRRRLIARVVLGCTRSEQMTALSELPEELVLEMERKMSEADPQAEVNIKLQCQCCGKQWEAAFDIGSFLWRELDSWALRVLREVHLLASAYGWRERDILAMSSWRRYAYLEMLDV